MDNHDNSITDNHQDDERREIIASVTEVIEGDTYPISDNESTTDSTSLIETHIIKDDDQGELNDSMSQDSLINDEEDNNKNIQQTASNSRINRKLKSTINPTRSINLDEHIKLVKQKKDEAEVLRLQKIQEQLQKKEQKWQQQQLERVRKWLQLRNRDTDHRTKVEERRKKREEEAKAKFDEILRREKERAQRTNSQITVNLRGNAAHKPDSLMSLSTDILSTRRAISAPRIRSNRQDMTNRRGSDNSPITTSSQDNVDNSATAISSHQVTPTDEHRYHHHQSRHSHDATMTNEDSSLSGTPHSSAHSRTRPMPGSYAFWLNTGDNNNHINANFMRLTYAASCRSRRSRSVERCPRACRARDDVINTTITTNPATTNGEPSQRRVQSVNRQHMNETILRLSKPKNIPMTQSIHLGATSSSSTVIPSSHSSHQLRVPTPPVTTNNHLTPRSTSSNNRKHIHSRPATASSHHVSSNNDSRASPSDESSSEHHPSSSSIRQSSHRIGAHPKPPLQSSSKPPISSSFSRSKPPVHRSLMSTSHSSSSLSSATTTNKQNIRRIGDVPPPSPPKQKPKPEPSPAAETPNTEISTKDNEEENLPVNEDTQENEQQIPVEVQPSTPPVEPINIDTITEIINPTVTSISKREQQMIDEQEYQRKLNQKIREAQQRLEVERQREEERQRQLELEEYEREQEQIRLVEEQRRAEQERLQRAIEERERENELKRQEEQRLQQQREELERKQTEETERLNRERQERAKKEEDERNERKKRLDLIMRRTRQVSPSPKPESNISEANIGETNGHDQQQTPIPHSIADNRFPTSVSTDNFLNNNDSSIIPETSKFKSPLIQNLLNKARNTRSTDNLTQSSMTTSQLTTENEVDERATTTTTTIRTDLSDDDQQDSGINNTINGHSNSPLSSSTNLNSYHDRPIETATAFQ